MNDNAIDISELAAFAGTYQQAIFTQFFNSFDAVKDFMFWPGVKNTIKMTKLTVKGGAKPYTGNFKPKLNEFQYTGLDLTVQQWQRDAILKPSDFRQSFMAQARGAGENPNNKTIPWAAFVWKAFLEQLAAGINDKAVYFGIGTGGFTAYDDGTDYSVGDKIAFVGADGETDYFNCVTATTAGQTPVTHPAKWDDWNDQAIFVGFGKIISTLISGGKLNPVVTGAIDNTDDAYQIQKELFRSLPVAIQKRGAVIFQSYTDNYLLWDSYEEKSKYVELDKTTGERYLAGTDGKCLIRPCTSMTGTRRLIASAIDNLIFATDEESDFNTIATEEHLYTLDVGMSGVVGVQIKDPDNMVVSDQS
ncbi:MAG TPA: hypothetical protein VHA56_16175 [Mucilaginibacter sp.]|nr:hypothetical protein [Mucilaginibacter sp.]